MDRLLFLFFFVGIFLTSCTTKQVYCSGPDHVFFILKGYAESEIDSCRIKRYEKGTNFVSLIDVYHNKIYSNSTGIDSQYRCVLGLSEGYDYRYSVLSDSLNYVEISNLSFYNGFSKGRGGGIVGSQVVEPFACPLISVNAVGTNVTAGGEGEFILSK